MTTLPDIPNLHDAVLESVAVEWEAAEAVIVVTRVPGGPLRLRARGLRRFVLSHEEVWGPSVYINQVTAEIDERGLVVLEIEMQSGDTVSVVADEVIAAPG